MTNILLIVIALELGEIASHLKSIAERGKEDAGKRDGN